jgi:hypothetical protein
VGGTDVPVASGIVTGEDCGAVQPHNHAADARQSTTISPVLYFIIGNWGRDRYKDDGIRTGWYKKRAGAVFLHKIGLNTACFFLAKKLNRSAVLAPPIHPQMPKIIGNIIIESSPNTSPPGMTLEKPNPPAKR